MLLIAGKASSTRSSTLSMPWPVAPEMEITSKRPGFLQLLRDIGHNFLIEQIAFVQRHDLRLILQPAAICFQLFAHNMPRLNRIVAGGVDQVDQDAAPFDMAQEPVANARAFGAPAIRPGISATTNSRPLWLTTPNCGRSVVKA